MLSIRKADAATIGTSPPPIPQIDRKPSVMTRSTSSASIIGADLTIVGNIVSGGELLIAGAIEGDIKGDTIVVQDTAKIIGTISARSVKIHGTVSGSVTASHLTLASTCKLVGDILHETLEIEQGALFEGKSKRSTYDANMNENAV